jgi:hypothetical protein
MSEFLYLLAAGAVGMAGIEVGGRYPRVWFVFGFLFWIISWSFLLGYFFL